ncbi:hypothetical protein KUM39_20725 [Streptomyces sp. J2-1]|nr:hypothetical protein [Streptomyces corallincola]
MIPAMPASSAAARRNSTTALRFGQSSFMAVLAALILFGGVWGSWGTAQHVMLERGRVQGSLKVVSCAGEVCAGPFTRSASAGPGGPDSAVIARSVAVRAGRSYDVVLKPGTREAVRAGTAGVLYAWVPLGGALLLASVVVAGGMRLRRAGWLLGLAGGALLTSAFFAVR